MSLLLQVLALQVMLPLALLLWTGCGRHSSRVALALKTTVAFSLLLSIALALVEVDRGRTAELGEERT